METEEQTHLDSRSVFMTDILERHEPVLIDTCVVGAGNLFGHLLEHEIYDGLDSETLDIEKKAQELYIGVMNNGRVLTIPEVRAEHESYMSRIAMRKRDIDRRCNVNINGVTGQVSEALKKARDLEVICRSFEYVNSLMRVSELDIREDPLYKTLVKTLNKTQEMLQVKERTGEKYENKGGLGDSDTDEKLVAAFYWILLNNENSGNSPAIVSCDYDILRLIGASYDVLSDKYLAPFNHGLTEVFEKQDFGVYIGNFENIGWVIKYSLKTAFCRARPKYNSAKRKNLKRQLKPILMNG